MIFAARAGGGSVALLASLLLASEAGAQAVVPAKGGGSLTLSYQNTSIRDHITYLGERIDRGHTQSHGMLLRLDYGLTDKWAVTGSVPYIRTRYVGDFGHQHDAFPDHHDEPEIDDGRYHGGWQDYSLGLRYQLRSEPLLVTPFVRVTYPTRDYGYHGHSSIGVRLWRVELGADVAKQFAAPLDKFYVQAGYGYSLREEAVGINIKSSLLRLELGYFPTPRLTTRLFAVWLKTHNGLDFPVDFPPPPSPQFFDHDRLLNTEEINLGAGLSWQLNEEYVWFGTWLTTVDGKNAHALHNAFTVGINRSF